MSENKNSNWYQLLTLIIKYKKLNSWIFGITTVAIIIIVFFIMPKKYTAEVSIFPGAASSAQNLSGKLGSLATLAGVNFGVSTSRSPEMYQGILFSRRLLEQIILQRYEFQYKDNYFKGNLIDFLEITGKSDEERLQKTLKIMRDYVLVVNIDPDNQILFLSVTLENPILASIVANSMTTILEGIVLNNLQIEFKEQDDYLKTRISLTNDSLKIVEEELKSFLENNPDPTLPKFQVEQLRLRRRIEVQSAVFIELRKQLELLNVQNFINLSPLKVLDKAFPPYRKSRPKRIFVTVTLLLLAGFTQIGVNGTLYLYRNYKTIYGRM